MERVHPNWVEQYAKCNLPSLFMTLASHIRQDVEDRKKIIHARQESLRFRQASDTQTQLLIWRSDPDQAGEKECEFLLSDRTITVRVEDPVQQYTITTRWDADAIQCRVVLTGAAATPIEYPHDELWKIVQVMLRPFFFPA
ncbi:MAG: hypothetical protein J4F42_02890 [Desulfurellaceae bacterium]|nr:hypothetical protein [Desulfurellaceae bacterium]